MRNHNLAGAGGERQSNEEMLRALLREVAQLHNEVAELRALLGINPDNNSSATPPKWDGRGNPF